MGSTTVLTPQNGNLTPNPITPDPTTQDKVEWPDKPPGDHIKPLSFVKQMAAILQQREHGLAAGALLWALGIWVGASTLLTTGQTHPVWPWIALTLGVAVWSARLWVVQGGWLLMVFWLAVGFGQQFQPMPPLGQVTVTGWLTQPRIFHVEQVTQADWAGELKPPFQLRLAKALPINTTQATNLTLRGEVRLPFGPALPGTFDERAYLTGLNIAGVLKPDQVEKQTLSAGGNLWAALHHHTNGIRQMVAEQLELAFADNPQDRALIGGLLLGDDALPLPKPYEKALLSTGLLHVVSASGANLMMVAALLLLICRYMPNQWVRRTCLVVGVTGYAWLTGFPPSIQRAYAVLAVGTMLKWVGLPFKPITLLLLAVAGLLTMVPWLALSVGFQLSVLATAGIVWLVPNMTYQRPGWWLWFAVPLAAELAVLPWSSTLFHQWSWAALPMNVLVDGLLLPLTWLASLGGVACGLGLHDWGRMIWQLATPLLWVFNTGVSSVSQWPGVMQTVPQWPAASLASWYALLSLGPLTHPPYRKPVLIVGLAGVLLPWLMTGMMLYLPHTRQIDLDDGQRLIARYNSASWCLDKPADWPTWRQRTLSKWLNGQGIPLSSDKPCLP